MPRQRRQISESGIYHIMLRGINQQQIFHDEEDYDKFIEILSLCKSISEFQLFAYCLMGNHIHLLIKEGKEPIALIFKRIGSRFVYWYNIKYHRAGHLFQDRYKSESINNDAYFLSALRYIHQNPVKANIIKTCEEYPYSSYTRYFKNDNLVDSDFLLDMMSLKDFQQFHTSDDFEKHIDIDENTVVRLTDEQAKTVIEEISGCRTVEDYQRLPQQKQIEYIKYFRDKHISIRQINRLTGVAVGIIRKY